jgi:hypothetical protein
MLAKRSTSGRVQPNPRSILITTAFHDIRSFRITKHHKSPLDFDDFARVDGMHLLIRRQRTLTRWRQRKIQRLIDRM